MQYGNDVPFSELEGKTLTAVNRDGDTSIDFVVNDALKYTMHHDQDCCESVLIEDVNGDLNDLVGTPIVKAEESTNRDNPKPHEDSHTWTFYHIRTMKGTVTIRWYGSSNGYYSEGVSLTKIETKGE